MDVSPSDLTQRSVTNVRQPRVSVGMPAYNGERFIESAIDSVLQQTFTDLELIITDNASTDRTVALCRAAAARDPRVRVIVNPVNIGVNPNYRKVAQAARGEFFKWTSANDLIDNDYIARCVKVLDERPDVVLAFGRTIVFQSDIEDGTPYDDHMNVEDDDPILRFRRTVEELRLNNAINGLIRREVLMRTSVHPDYFSSDNVVLSELALAGKLVEVPETRFFRRMDKESATRLQSAAVVQRAHFPSGGFARFFQAWRLQFGYFSAVTHSHLQLRKRLRAWRCVLRQTYWASPSLFADFKEAFAFYALRNRR